MKTLSFACLCMLAYVATAGCQSALAIETYVGKLEFQDQTIARETAEKLHREIDLQRASQLTLWAMPVVSMNMLHRLWYDDLGVPPDSTAVGLFQGYDAVYPYLTANVTTPYTIACLDLEATGPVVVKIPAGGVYGVANNAWQQPIKEINSGKAETLLFVGPGQTLPKDFAGEVVQSDTFKMLYFYRVLGSDASLSKEVKAYKLADAANPPTTPFVTYEPKPGNSVRLNTQPVDMNFWEMVNEYVQKEPMADRDRFFYAWLRALGIEKGKPFQPSAYQKEILMEGVTVGMAMGQAIAFNKRFPTAKYRGDSGWEDVMAGMDPKIDLATYSMFDERASYTYEAVTTSEGMTKRVVGKGSAYLGTYYDADGNALMGSHRYKLHIEPKPPAANFWSITVYDIKNRLIIRNAIRKSDLSSRTKGLEVNADGSVDLYFDTTSPAGKEANWVQTNPGESFFLYLRLYGPLEPFIDESWPMNKVKKVK